ncbi:MAG TPA: hypothetical protein VJM09_11560 [Sphingobium sp.]|nr:hypothetical protein [Sphingobium sp.]
MNDLAQYLAAILLEKARVDPDEAYGGSERSIRDQLARDVGGSVAKEDVHSALEVLQPFAAAESDFSPLTGGFWTINYDNFRYYFVEGKPDSNDDAEQFQEIHTQTALYPILEAYARRGARYALDATQHLRSLNFEDWLELRGRETSAPRIAPASNRIVTLSHNQQADLELASTEVIDALSTENSIDGNPQLRDAALGQLRAARELIRGQSLNAYLLYSSAVILLEGLIKRYGGQAIGHAAKKLLDLMIEHIFGK